VGATSHLERMRGLHWPPQHTDCRFWSGSSPPPPVSVGDVSGSVFYWWDTQRSLCLPCSRCVEPLHTMNHCTIYRDTQCGTRHQLNTLLNSLGVHLTQEDDEDHGDYFDDDDEGVRVYESSSAARTSDEVFGEKKLEEEEEKGGGGGGGGATREILHQRMNESGRAAARIEAKIGSQYGRPSFYRRHKRKDWRKYLRGQSLTS